MWGWSPSMLRWGQQFPRENPCLCRPAHWCLNDSGTGTRWVVLKKKKKYQWYSCMTRETEYCKEDWSCARAPKYPMLVWVVWLEFLTCTVLPIVAVSGTGCGGLWRYTNRDTWWPWRRGGLGNLGDLGDLEFSLRSCSCVGIYNSHLWTGDDCRW